VEQTQKHDRVVLVPMDQYIGSGVVGTIARQGRARREGDRAWERPRANPIRPQRRRVIDPPLIDSVRTDRRAPQLGHQQISVDGESAPGVTRPSGQRIDGALQL
jgi:hypothetical protein